jgi:DNA modification methylase
LAKAGGVYKPKDLVGIPWMVAFELRRRGWYLRSDIIWAKKNSMPEPFKDRPTKGHEYIFLLTKKSKYFYDRDGFHQPFAESSMSEAAEEYDGEGTKDYEEAGVQNPSDAKRRIVASMRKRIGESYPVAGAKKLLMASEAGFNDRNDVGNVIHQNINGPNLRTVWHIATKAYKGAHFATFTDEIPMRCIKLGTSEVGACATCGTPYARVTRSEGGGIGQDWHPDKSLGNGRAQGIAATGLNDGTYRRVDLGFQKKCSCDTEDIVPCIVLDVFAGTGTTMATARNLGRRSIGIDLNGEYIEKHQEARPEIGGPSFVDAW